MATHGDIGLSQPAAATTTFKLDSITLDANSTAVHREVMVVGSPETTNALTAVLAAQPNSTAWGLAVRVVGGPSTISDLIVRTVAPSTYGDGGLHRVAQSTASDLLVRPMSPSTYADVGIYRVQNSSALDLRARVDQGIANSSAGDRWSVISAPASTVWASSAGFHFDSSGGLLITPANAGGVDYTHGSTFTLSSITGPAQMLTANTLPTAVSTGQFVASWGTLNGAQNSALVTSSGGLIDGSTVTAAHGILGLNVRQVPSSYQSTIVTVQSSNSTVLMTVLSSVAGLTHKVYAYFLGASTSGNNSTIIFLSSGLGGDAQAAKARWQVVQTSGMFGANLAINPTGGAFLFKTDASEPLTCRIESASTRVIESIAISWVTE
jgi:hypothetical protein